MSESSAKPGPVPRDQREPLLAAVEEMGLGIGRVTLEGTWLLGNQRFCEILGYSAGELPLISFREYFGSTEVHSDGGKRERLLSGEISGYTTENVVIRRDGVPISIRTAFSTIRDKNTGQVLGLFLLVQEITREANAEQDHKEFAGRLVRAQDSERSRIARELHDHIGQELAILAVQIQRAGKPISGEPGKMHADIPELCARTQSIATQVSQLAHQLHSSKLEYLGLAQAVRVECRDFAKASRIAVECSCEDIPGHMDSAIGTCCLRVVQEALHNISKHSRATKVKVELTSTTSELQLAVSDNGVGFDVEKARLAKGFGLISMRERLQLAGGEFNISSEPGRGTQVVGRFPLSVAHIKSV